MSAGGRAELRKRSLRWGGLSTGAVALLTVLSIAGGHLILGAFFGVVAVLGVLVLWQIRTVR